jgi:beta-lactamase superfamily II metal-dependent hydrolase
MDARPCRRGDSWRWDGVVFSYLSPVSQAVGESVGGQARLPEFAEFALLCT